MKHIIICTLFLIFNTSMLLGQVQDIFYDQDGPVCIIYHDSELYIYKRATNKIASVDLDRSSPRVKDLFSPLNEVWDMAVWNNKLLYSVYDELFIVEYNPGPDPFVIANDHLISDLHVEEDTLYYLGFDEIKSFDLNDYDQIREEIASNLNSISSFVKEGDFIYMTHYEGGLVLSADLSQVNVPIDTLARGLNKPRDLVLHDQFLYIAEVGKVSRVNIDGSEPILEDMATGLSNTLDLAAGTDNLYIAQYEADRISKLDLSLTSAKTLQISLLNVYPNPTADILNLGAENIHYVYIYDGSGNTVLHQLRPDQTIDISTLPNGIYHVLIRSNEGIESTAFVKI